LFKAKEILEPENIFSQIISSTIYLFLSSVHEQLLTIGQIIFLQSFLFKFSVSTWYKFYYCSKSSNYFMNAIIILNDLINYLN